MGRLIDGLRSALYATAFLLVWGWLGLAVRSLDAALAIRLPPASRLVGLASMCAGGALALSCVALLAIRGRGTPAPFDPPRRFVAVGPYRWVRNPMYVGGVILFVGFGLWHRSASILALAALAWVLLHLFVVLVEEPGLRRRFGSAYDAYLEAASRWIPRRPTRDGGRVPTGARPPGRRPAREESSMEEGRSRGPIPWTRIAAEGVAIVASILLAFAIDAWWDSRLEAREERELLTNLHREFLDNRSQLDFRIRNHERLAEGARALVERLSAAAGSAVIVPDSLLLTLFITPTFDPALGTLEEAQSSGRIRLIRSAELRGLLGAWPGSLRDAREEERLGLELVQSELYPAIARRVDLSDLMREGGDWLAGHASEILGAGERTVPVTPGLANFAQMRWVRSRRAAEELTGLRTRLAEIVERLERELER